MVRYLSNVHNVLNVSKVHKNCLLKHASTRIDKESESRINELMKQTGLKRAEILRRLIYLGLSRVKEPEDLLKISRKEG